MSTLLTDKFTGVTTAGSIDVTGEGNSTTTNLQQGFVKSWVHILGKSTATIPDSFNVSSLNDVATGIYETAFTNSMANANHCSAGMARESTSDGGNNRLRSVGFADSSDSISTGQVETVTAYANGSVIDPATATTITVGELA